VVRTITNGLRRGQQDPDVRRRKCGLQWQRQPGRGSVLWQPEALVTILRPGPKSGSWLEPGGWPSWRRRPAGQARMPEESPPGLAWRCSTSLKVEHPCFQSSADRGCRSPKSSARVTWASVVPCAGLGFRGVAESSALPGQCSDNGLLGYSVNRSKIRTWISLAPGFTTRGPRASSRPGLALTRTAWTTWSGCAGRVVSAARPAVVPGAGGWAMAGSSAPLVMRALR
jgi:hypothetical protein